MEEKFKLKRILGNSLWQISEKIVTLLLSVFVTSFIARYLGVENYGVVNYVISTVTLFTTFSVLGMETLTIKGFVQNTNPTNIIIGTSFIIRIIGGIVLIVASQITLYFLSKGDIIVQILGAIMGTCMLVKAFEVIEYYAQAMQKMKITALIRFISTAIVSIYKVLVVVLDLGMVGFIFSYLLDAVIVAILLYIWYKGNNKEKWKFNKLYASNLLKNCWYLAVSGLMSTIYMKMDQVMLGSMLTSKIQSGIYAAAVRIAELWYFVPLAVITAFQPSIIQAKKNNQQEFLKLQQKLYDIISIIGICAIIGISIFGKFAVTILYGNEYMEASKILLISIWSGLFATLGSARSPWLISENLQKYTIIYISSGAVINMILNVVLIPRFGGYGAAVATLIAQIVAVILVPVMLKKIRISGVMMLKAIFANNIIKNILKRGKKMIKEILKSNKIFRKFYDILFNIKKKFLIKYFPKTANKYLYKKIFHKNINLKSPRTFNEKIIWLNLNTYYRNKKVSQCADKYLVRQYIEKKGYKDILINLLGVYDDVKSIKWEELPKKFVLKCNHGAGFNIICTDKSEENEHKVKEQLQSWLKIDYSKSAAEFQYNDIDRKILCEEYINMGETGKLPVDYKINCFNGKAKCILVCSEREKGLKLDYYDLNWNKLDYIVDKYKSNKEQDKPENLKEMIKIAEDLSKEFPYVRVDLYNIKGKIYFGELTFTPAAGLIAYMNNEGQEILGDLIKIY